MQTLSEFLSYASIWSILLPILAGLLRWKNLDIPSQVIFFLSCVASVPQFWTLEVFPVVLKFPLYNFYTLVEVAFMFALFALPNYQGAVRRINFILLLIFYVFGLYAFLFWDWRHKFLNVLLLAANLSYIFWIFSYLLVRLWQDQPPITPAHPLFWYVLAVLLYSACTCLVIALTYSIKDEGGYLWLIQSLFNILMYALFAVGILRNRQSEASKVLI